MEGYIAQICAVGFNFAPKNWAFCDGRTINIASNTALFSLLGTTYGGNGQTTFNIPDLRGRVIVGQGSGPGLSNYQLGQAGGTETVTLTTNQMPSHIHTLSGMTASLSGTATATMKVNNAAGGDAFPANNYLAGASSEQLYATTTSGDTLNPAAISVNTSGLTVNLSGSSTGPTGGNMPFDVRTPYLALNYCICLYGIYPSRN